MGPVVGVSDGSDRSRKRSRVGFPSEVPLVGTDVPMPLVDRGNDPFGGIEVQDPAPVINMSGLGIVRPVSQPTQSRVDGVPRSPVLSAPVRVTGPDQHRAVDPPQGGKARSP